MTERHFLLVVYDISNDRRRTKLHQTLLDYGTPVQYSVFECWVNEKEENRLKRAVKRVIRPRQQDHVRYYHLCATCVDKIEVLGQHDVTGPLPAALIVGDPDGG